MGFDLYIHLNLLICPKTGKPYYFDHNLEKIYDLPDFIIPKHLRPYLQGRGPQFHVYLQNLNTEGQTEVDLEEFLENYPEWKEVFNDEAYDNTWTQEDHNTFADLLEYLHTLSYPFRISWSY